MSSPHSKKPKQKSLKSDIKSILLWTIIIVFGCYTAFWFTISHFLNKQIMAYQEHLPATEQLLDVSVTGFPAPHTVRAAYRKSLPEHGIAVSIPALTVQSFFIPGHDVTIDLPRGLRIKALSDTPVLPSQKTKKALQSLSIDAVHIKTQIVKSLPRNISERAIRNWYEKGHAQIPVTEFTIRSGDIEITGSGVIALDEALQPDISSEIRIFDPAHLLEMISRYDLLNDKEDKVMRFMVASMQQTDEASGRPYIDLPITLQNRALRLGAVRVGYIDLIQWANEDNSPARGQ